MAKVAFTASRVAGFKCPADKNQAFMWDSNALGLGLRATPDGKPAYIFQGRYQGATVRVTIGNPDAWAIPEAQAKARELQRLIDAGQDPRSAKRQAKAAATAEKEQAQAKRQQDEREALTFGTAWAAYIAERRQHWGALTLRDHDTMLDAGGKPKLRGAGLTKPAPLAPFAAMRLIDINADTVQAWAAQEGKTRPTRARLALNLLGGFFNWCNESAAYASLVPDKNPVQNKRARELLGKVKAKQDALLKEQLPAWFAAAKGLQTPAVSAYLQCLLLTGARPTELLQLRWDDINTDWHSLSIRDKDESKGGLDGRRIIPLTPYVQHLIERLPKRSQWVFSSNAAAQPIQKPNRRLHDVCAVAGIEHLTLHGLRRSFGSLAEWLELPAGVIAQIQGHKPSATAEKHYRVRPLDLLRQHHERLEGWILEQAGVPFDPEAGGGKLKLIKIA